MSGKQESLESSVAARDVAATEALSDEAWEAAAEAAERNRAEYESGPASSDSLPASGGAVPASDGAGVGAGKPVEQSQDGNEAVVKASVDPGNHPVLVAEGEGGEVVYPDAQTLAASDNQDVYRAMSAADERQIAQELEGKAVKAMLYSFPQQGGQVIGFSWKGVAEAIRQVNTRGHGRIASDRSQKPEYEMLMLKTEIGRDGNNQPIYGEVPAVQCTIYVYDEIHGTGFWGTAIQTVDQVNKQKQDPDTGLYMWQPDPFSRTKALNKAQRNAMEHHIPLWLREELIKLYQGQGRVEYIDAVAVEVEDRPPALTDKRAEDQQAKCRELYDEIKQKHGLKLLPPAKFNSFMAAAQHSHDRLDDMIAHLESLLNPPELEEGDG